MRSMKNWLAGLLSGRTPGTRPRSRLAVECLEDRTVPAALTILGSHLLTSGGVQQAYAVDGITGVLRGDITVDVSPGTYSVLSGSTQSYGTFTVSGAGTLAATGALTAAGSAIDFDRTRLAAVTVKASDFVTLKGRAEFLYVENEVSFRQGGGDDTAYLPDGDYFLDTEVNARLGSFTVDGGSVTATTGAVEATGDTVSVDRMKLVAVTVNGNGYQTAKGIGEALGLSDVTSFLLGDRNDTVYLPAGTFHLVTGAFNAALGSFTVAPNGSVIGATGALQATSNRLDINLAKLAPVLVKANDFHTAAGRPQSVGVSDVTVGFLSSTGDRDDTVYLPAGTFTLSTGDHAIYGSITVSETDAGNLAVSSTDGAIRATGNVVTWSTCDLANVRISPAPGVQWRLDHLNQVVINDRIADTDTAFLPPTGGYALWIIPPGSPGFTEPFDIGPSGLSATQLPHDAPLVTLELVPCHLSLLIDVKVGNTLAPINVASQGVLPVVLFGGEGFDVTQVNLGTVRFVGAAVSQSSFADVNGDGRLDLLLKFRTQDTNLQALYERMIADDINADGVLDSTRQVAQVELTGQTAGHDQIVGVDEVNLFLSGRRLRELLDQLFAAW